MERILTETMAPIRADIQAMKDDNQVMKDDIQVIKNDILVMKDDILVMKDDIRDIKRVQGQVWKLAARVSYVSSFDPSLIDPSQEPQLVCRFW